MMNDDRVLMRRIRAGDEQAFAALVTRHGGRMLSVASHLLGSRTDGEDAVQRAFLRCFTAARAYRPEWAVSTWLYRILTHVCFDEIRRRRVRGEVSVDGAGGERRASRADRVADRLDIDRALMKVPAEARTLIVLRYADGLSYGELARVRGITINTVKSQLARGKSILRAALDSKPNRGEDRR